MRRPDTLPRRVQRRGLDGRCRAPLSALSRQRFDRPRPSGPGKAAAFSRSALPPTARQRRHWPGAQRAS